MVNLVKENWSFRCRSPTGWGTPNATFGTTHKHWIVMTAQYHTLVYLWSFSFVFLFRMHQLHKPPEPMKTLGSTTRSLHLTRLAPVFLMELLMWYPSVPAGPQSFFLKVCKEVLPQLSNRERPPARPSPSLLQPLNLLCCRHLWSKPHEWVRQISACLNIGIREG